MKLALGLLAVLVSATIAHADPLVATARADRSHASGTIGLGTPVGQLGIEGTFVFHRNFEVGVGLGVANMVNIGDTGKPDPQVAIMPRVRLPVGPLLFTVGAGLSGGGYTVGASPFGTGALHSDAFQAKTTALWANAEVGVEYFADDGGFGGAYVGGGKVIAHGDVVDGRGNVLMSLPDDTLPYVGLKLGHVF